MRIERKEEMRIFFPVQDSKEIVSRYWAEYVFQQPQIQIVL